MRFPIFFSSICFQTEMFDPSVFYEKANIPSITMGEFFFDLVEHLSYNSVSCNKVWNLVQLCDSNLYHLQTKIHFIKWFCRPGKMPLIWNLQDFTNQVSFKIASLDSDWDMSAFIRTTSNMAHLKWCVPECVYQWYPCLDLIFPNVFNIYVFFFFFSQ